MNKYLFIFLTALSFQLFSASDLSAATTTWTGSTGSDWATATNWDTNAVPTVEDEVIISITANSPSIQAGTDAVAKSVKVNSEGELSLDIGSTLGIDGSTGVAIFNSGTIHNSGTITIGENAAIGYFGIFNGGSFTNDANGEIFIDQTANDGMYISSSSGITFDNSGKITIGANAAIGGNGIYNGATFNNNANGEIFVDQTTKDGIYNGNNLFTNSGKITIGGNTAIGKYGIENRKTFINEESGEISIDYTTETGLFNVQTFTNSGKITIGKNESIGDKGIENQRNFTNNITGEISIDQTSAQGIYGPFNDISIFINSGKITIGANEAIGGYGIYSVAVFNNEISGEVFIDRTNKGGIFSLGIATNSGKITIGANGAINGRGMFPWGTFTNEASGEISIDQTSEDGISVSSSPGTTFDNSGKITIGANAAIGGYGIANSGTFTNNGNGEIFVDQTTKGGIYNSHNSFTNLGKINIGGNAAIGKYGIDNRRTFINEENGEIFVDQTTDSGIYNFFTFTNSGKITLGENAGIGIRGIQNKKTFTNESSGEISIDQAVLGIYNLGAATFNNSGKIIMGANAGIGNTCISNTATFTNESDGEIALDKASFGITNNSIGMFTNSGKITIGENAIVNGRGINNGATFMNNATGEIHIDRINGKGISNSTTGAIFTNIGKITLGANALIGGYGIENQNATFINEATGEIYIDQTGSHRIHNSTASADFTNSGKIIIGTNEAIGLHGIRNIGTFTNKISGEINIFETMLFGIWNQAIFINEICATIHCNGEIKNEGAIENKGFLFSDFEGSHSALRNSSFTNTGVIQDFYGSFEWIVSDNQDVIISPFSNCEGNVFPNILQIGIDNSFTIGSDWYTDETLSTDAGDYNQGTNTFTLDIPTGEHTLYMEVTDNDNTCTQVMAIQLKTHTPPTVSVETNELCAGDDLNLTATGEGAIEWEWSGPNNFTSHEQNPTISATTSQNSGDYTVIVTNENGCTATSSFDVDIPEAFSIDLDDATQTQTATGMNIYVVEICGGTLPYSVGFSSEGGFASVQQLFASGSCRTLRISYTSGVEWTAVVEDSNECSGEGSTISSDMVGGIDAVQIEGFNVVKETGVGELDGELTVTVSGGDDSCGEYTYALTGPSTNVSQIGTSISNTMTGLRQGNYTVVVTDCAGNTVTGTTYVGREGRGRRGNRGKTSLDTSINESLQLQPNPANNFVQVKFSTKQAGERIVSIADLAGRIVWLQVVNEDEGEVEVSLDDFKSGLYIVTLSADGQLKGRTKLIVTK